MVRRTPFTIQLTIATGESKQPVSLGVDAGYKHVGLSASTEKAELYASQVELRQDITDLLSARRALRRARRNRKTRYRAPRFDNRIRTKRKGWLAPSVENRINAHLSRIETVLRMLPVTKITVETASFDMLLLKSESVTYLVAFVVCATMAVTVCLAKIVGSTLPLLAKKLGFDPAVMASPIITTIVDFLSLLVYFAFATAILGIG